MAQLTGSAILVALLAACSGNRDAGSPPGEGPLSERPTDPGVVVSLSLPKSVTGEVQETVTKAEELDASSLLAAHAVTFRPQLGYDPRAAGLDLIQGSPLALDERELHVLGERGFVVVPRHQFPSFPYAYTAIYVNDLPVFVSSDMVLEAVHRSYDDILKALELTVLGPRVERLVASMRSRLASGDHGLSSEVARDVDVYLSVAHGLLKGNAEAPVAGASSKEVQELVTAAMMASGEQRKTLFGVPRRFDFSQFKPRGHYTESEALQRYFRAMMWMGRIDFRLIETQEDGSQVFQRRQLDAALALRELMDDAALADWKGVDATVTAFVGEHDYMHLLELDELLTSVGVEGASQLSQVPDERIAQAIVDGQFGQQRIASHIMRAGSGAGPLPLNASFAFFGQRYVVDSHVFSNVVFDRVPTRVLPNPLDAAFAALGNDQAVGLLSEELEKEVGYPGALAATRALVDQHPAEYWQGSLYTSWLGALRTLSPNAPGAGPEAAGLPGVARTDAWGRRLLSTQLASWAQLRHDTILYAKQSYSGGPGCDFPDAYVEPYPEFFRKLVAFAERGLGLVETLDFSLTSNTALADQVRAYFGNLARVSTTLAEMAEAQRTGVPHGAEHLKFIKQAIRIEGGGSGDPWQTGWYKELFFDRGAGIEFDPTIADVHTDVGGDAPVPRPPSVLHVGTGMPRTMVVTIDTCEGPRAYAGAVFAYHELVERGFTRLTDEEWSQRLTKTQPPEVEWLSPALP